MVGFIFFMYALTIIIPCVFVHFSNKAKDEKYDRVMNKRYRALHGEDEYIELLKMRENEKAKYGWRK